MNAAVYLLLLVGLVSGQQFVANKPDQPAVEVTERCLDCICQASSNCDETAKCHTGGGGGYFCGPYVISWAYWADGGKPGYKGGSHDFETCLTNRTCAEKAVKGYMRKYAQDCDGNGEIDCNDFARIHKLGFGQCSGSAILDTDYWQKFDICYNPPDPADNYDNYGNEEIDARSYRNY